MILEDVALLGLKPDVFTFTSDHFERILGLCSRMLESGKAYVDDTDAETMKKEREERVESAARSNCELTWWDAVNGRYVDLMAHSNCSYDMLTWWHAVTVGWTGCRAFLLLPNFSASTIIIYTRCKYFDPCYALATVVRARFLAAAFSDGCYLAHVNGAYLRHVTFCIVRGPPLFIISPICQRGPLPTLTVPGWSKVHDGDVEGVEQTCRGTPASPILV